MHEKRLVKIPTDSLPYPSTHNSFKPFSMPARLESAAQAIARSNAGIRCVEEALQAMRLSVMDHTQQHSNINTDKHKHTHTLTHMHTDADSKLVKGNGSVASHSTQQSESAPVFFGGKRKKYVYTQICMYTYIYTCMCVYIYMYIYIYIC